MLKRHRIFVAINLPYEVERALAEIEKKWPDLPARWTDTENIHITLEFLGDMTEVELGEVCMVVKEVAARHEAFAITLREVLYGPPGKMPPRMVWVEGEKSKELSTLKKDLQESLLEKVRFQPEHRAFSPHITLARIKEFEFRAIEPEERPQIQENLDLNFSVESIEVMESVLTKGGPKYTMIESFPLNN